MKKKFIDTTEESLNRYFKDIEKKKKTLNTVDEVELAIRIQNGDEKAIEELVSTNLKFVISVAKEYQGNGVSLPDMINDGNEGIIKAAYRFDHTKGFKFISYAVWWIRQSILQGLNENSRGIRLPVNVINKLSKINKKITEFELKEGREPYLGENIGDEQSPIIYEDIGYPQISSIDVPINEDGDEFSSMLLDEDSEIIVNNDNLIKIELEKVLSELTTKERMVIELYFGLNEDFEPMILEDIGEKIGVTKERVRQIKEKAIRKLRHYSFNLYTLINE